MKSYETSTWHGIPHMLRQERLGELKDLLGAELISQEEFDAKRAEIIQSL